MSDATPVRGGWVLPVLLAIATAAALGFGFLFITRPNAGELGAIRVVVSDDNGKSGSAIHVIVAEAPFVQKDTISPGPAASGTAHYPLPYLTKPNLKLTGGKRQYGVLAESESGFTWVARLLPDDLRDGAPKEGGILEKLVGDDTAMASLKGNLKPGLTFEDFTWEAKGVRAPTSAIPVTFEQTGTFFSTHGREGTEFFQIPYDSPPHVELSSEDVNKETFIVDCTPKSFKWRQDANTFWVGPVTWKARGVRNASAAK